MLRDTILWLDNQSGKENYLNWSYEISQTSESYRMDGRIVEVSSKGQLNDMTCRTTVFRIAEYRKLEFWFFEGVDDSYDETLIFPGQFISVLVWKKTIKSREDTFFVRKIRVLRVPVSFDYVLRYSDDTENLLRSTYALNVKNSLKFFTEPMWDNFLIQPTLKDNLTLLCSLCGNFATEKCTLCNKILCLDCMAPHSCLPALSFYEMPYEKNNSIHVRFDLSGISVSDPKPNYVGATLKSKICELLPNTSYCCRVGTHLYQFSASRACTIHFTQSYSNIEYTSTTTVDELLISGFDKFQVSLKKISLLFEI